MRAGLGAELRGACQLALWARRRRRPACGPSEASTWARSTLRLAEDALKQVRHLQDPGLLDNLKTALSKRILNAELDTHLGAEHGEAEASRRPNRRNGTSAKTVLMGTSKVRLDIP